MLHSLLSYFASSHCGPRSFFGIPSWDKFLHGATQNGTPYINPTTCEFQASFFREIDGQEQIDFAAFTLIGLGVLDILLRLAALISVGFIVYGGIQYVLSQGEPDKAKKATGTIINALIGLGVTVVAAAVVSFIGNAVG